jgi:amino acid transporter
VPLVGLIVTFVVGLIVFLPFPSWQQLVGFVTSATVLSFGAGTLALSSLRRELPDAERPFKVPGGDVVAFLAFYASNLIVYWAGWNVDWKLFVAILLGFALLPLFHWINRDRAPAVHLRSGASWTIPWLGGLALISWLGDYPSPTAGNRAVIGFGWGFVAVLALTAIVYAIALRTRLPRPVVEEHIEESRAEAAREASELEAAV